MTSLDNTKPRKPSLFPVVSNDRLTQADTIADIAEQTADEAGYLGFTTRVFTQTCLPYQDPWRKNPDMREWVRKNGPLTLMVQPASVVEADGSIRRGFPYGKYPRLILPWLTTQIIRNQEDRETTGELTLEFSTSLPKFLRELGLGDGGRQTSKLREQLPLLFGSTISVTETGWVPGKGAGVRRSSMQIAPSYELWWNDEGLSNDGLWGNTVTLSRAFVDEVLSVPIPLDLRALAVVSKHGPLAMDMLTWLNYRLHTARKSSELTWSQLNQQFGAQYAVARQFKAQFIKRLPIIQTVYPDANIHVTESGVRVAPSPSLTRIRKLN